MNVNTENATREAENEREIIIDDFAERTKIRLGKSNRCFYMDFGDVDFPNRLLRGRQEIGRFLESKREELGVENIDDIKTENYSLEEIEKVIKVSLETDRYIKDRLNDMFGYDVSQDVFGIASSISVTRKGEYYFDSFLNSILPLVEREYKVRINATNERIKKYTDQKGKYPAHPALKK